MTGLYRPPCTARITTVSFLRKVANRTEQSLPPLYPAPAPSPFQHAAAGARAPKQGPRQSETEAPSRPARIPLATIADIQKNFSDTVHRVIRPSCAYSFGLQHATAALPWGNTETADTRCQESRDRKQQASANHTCHSLLHKLTTGNHAQPPARKPLSRHLSNSPAPASGHFS